VRESPLRAHSQRRDRGYGHHAVGAQ
jgi:hypothetical protein